MPSYQPTHDWLLSTKRGEKKGGGGGLRVSMGNQEACVDFKKRFQENPPDVCVCVQVCGYGCIQGCFLWSSQEQSLGH